MSEHSDEVIQKIDDTDLANRRSEILDLLGLKELSFDYLQKLYQRAARLATTSFREERDGFRNINGDGVLLGLRGDRYVLIELSVQAFHNYVVGHPGILQNGSPDKNAMMRALREMVESCGNRIIE